MRLVNYLIKKFLLIIMFKEIWGCIMIDSLKIKSGGIALMFFVLFLCFLMINPTYGQGQRNPVLEFCTGTW